MKISGIYKIVNKLDKKCYVGSSCDIVGSSGTSGRFYNHKRLLLMGKHHCVHLQRAYNRDGEANFEYIIIESVNTSDLLKVEQKYLDIARDNPTLYYNCSFDAGMITMTNETRAKIGEKQKLRLSDPTKHHMYGKKHSPSTIIKLKEARKRQVISQESQDKGARTRTGRKCPEHSRRMGGLNNSNSDKTIYCFTNVITNENFTGTKYSFRKFYNLPIWYPKDLISHGKIKRGWKFIGRS